MSTISEYMLGDHKACDEAFARVEDAVEGRDWVTAEAGFKTFCKNMNRHFAMEEDVLFSALEDETGMGGSPTPVFRSEHVQMRVLLDEMKSAIEARDSDRYLGESETLLVLMQQHNMKEEGMLYQMMDQTLASQAAGLIGRCNAVE